MRVGIVTHYMPPHVAGIELVAEALFAAYAAAGWDVRWVASRVPKTSAAEEGGRIRVPCWNGLEYRFRVPWPVWGPSAIRELTRLVQWSDVLHAHECLYMGSALAVLLARRARKPVILTQHVGFVRYPSPLLNRLESFAYHTVGWAVLRGASHVVCCTPAAEQFVAQLLRGRASRVSAIANGVDVQRFHPATPAERAEARQRLGVPPSKRVVLFVGRLVERKGADVFRAACLRMPSEHFLMVGDGPLRPDAAENLTWIPSFPPEDMPLIYQAADAFVLPSHSEGFPLSVQEAMAAGVPVIVTKGEPFTDVLERSGVCLATERTPEACSEALDYLWSHAELREKLASASRELVVREWSLQTMGARYLQLMATLTPQ